MNRLNLIKQAAKKVQKEQKPVLTDKDLSAILQSEYAAKTSEYSEQRKELDFN